MNICSRIVVITGDLHEYIEIDKTMCVVMVNTLGEITTRETIIVIVCKHLLELKRRRASMSHCVKQVE